MNEFADINQELIRLINEWEPVLSQLPKDILTERRNRQNRTIKQILGHMIDSASNNTHRIVHLQYQASPLIFPDYANLGNNDKWIAIQNYQDENWDHLVQLWKYSNLHIVHVINNVSNDKLDNVWINALNKEISLREMIVDYLRHFKLHLNEISDLINNKI
ncbi:MAG: DinB family protein [Hungateiclostridium thermocellum]|nr:DinB family protein [Acetivibrio thermocellus]